MDSLLLKAVVSDSLGLCKRGNGGAMFRVSKVMNTGVGDARSSDGVRLVDWLALSRDWRLVGPRRTPGRA